MKHIHILGICGTFMGGVAMIAKQMGYHVTDDLKSFSITYEITNLSDKAILEAQWLTVYKENNQPFYVANLPALQFGKTIAPKASETVTLSTTEEAVLSQIRPHLQQGKNIQVDIIGTSVHFTDGSKVGLVSEQK